MAKGFFSGLFGQKDKKSENKKDEGQKDIVENDDRSIDILPNDDPEKEVLLEDLPPSPETVDPSPPLDENDQQETLARARLDQFDEDVQKESNDSQVPGLEQDESGSQEEQPSAEQPPLEQEVPQKKRGLFARLKEGLSKTSTQLTDGVSSIFTKKKLDDEMLEELENLLISSDLGVSAAARITGELAKNKFDKEVTHEEVREALATDIAATLHPYEKPLTIDATERPHIILMTGVNGAGKTTTIGKLASIFKAQGKTVMLAAGDTFRAAAIEQLTVWGERTNTPVIARDVGADAAGLAFDAIKEAQSQNIDVLMIDTAGRLQNKTQLMDELEKIVRVIAKISPDAPHDTVLVLDATVGQNALSQVEVFQKTAGVTGLVMTKMDGTARGGVLVALAEKFGLPIHYIGVGESVEDLQPFSSERFAKALTGLTQ